VQTFNFYIEVNPTNKLNFVLFKKRTKNTERKKRQHIKATQQKGDTKISNTNTHTIKNRHNHLALRRLHTQPP
jgi:hypothetical protein